MALERGYADKFALLRAEIDRLEKLYEAAVAGSEELKEPEAFLTANDEIILTVSKLHSRLVKLFMVTHYKTSLFRKYFVRIYKKEMEDF